MTLQYTPIYDELPNQGIHKEELHEDEPFSAWSAWQMASSLNALYEHLTDSAVAGETKQIDGHTHDGNDSVAIDRNNNVYTPHIKKQKLTADGQVDFLILGGGQLSTYFMDADTDTTTEECTLYLSNDLTSFSGLAIRASVDAAATTWQVTARLNDKTGANHSTDSVNIGYGSTITNEFTLAIGTSSNLNGWCSYDMYAQRLSGTGDLTIESNSALTNATPTTTTQTGDAHR